MSNQRRSTTLVQIGTIGVGSARPIIVQSMTNTDTADIESTVRQVEALARAGSELVRITVNSAQAAAAVAPVRWLRERRPGSAIRSADGRMPAFLRRRH